MNLDIDMEGDDSSDELGRPLIRDNVLFDANEQQPASVKDFLDNSPFELIDTAGQEVVKLTRSFGDEK